MEPQYAFSIPCIEDDTALDCRIYHPEDLRQNGGRASHVTGAIIAHPYAPLGGCYDDQVVLAVTQTLLDRGFIVGTFNFRSAGESAGRTSWTGKPEMQDYVSFAGFLIYYLQRLSSMEELDRSRQSSETPIRKIHLVFGGYSYGSLILARFPPTLAIIKRFETAERGTAAAEIILRARTLANQTRQALEEHHPPASPRGRTLKPEQSPTSPSKRASPMTVGGEETDPSERRRSRESRRSVDVIRKSVDVPHRIKEHVKHRHVSHGQTNSDGRQAPATTPTVSSDSSGEPKVSTTYLFISPVLMPFKSMLLPPGAPTSGFSMGKADTGVGSKQYLNHRTLALFGSNDAFTSSKRLKHWAEKVAAEAQADFQWSEIEGAGHFWGEPGVLKALRQRIGDWVAQTDNIQRQTNTYS